MNPSFWCGKRIFLTGHTGFKGGWLSLWLQSLGADVTGYALLPPTNPSLFEVARVAEKMVSTIADIRDLPKLQGHTGRAARHRHPHGGTALGSIFLPESCRDLLYQRHGYGASARGGEELAKRQGCSRCYYRQVLRKQRVAMGLS